MNSILVTGGAGFIGSNFIRFLLRQGEDLRIVNLDALTYAGSLLNLNGMDDNPRYMFIHGDIVNQPLVEGLLNKHSVDTIVHLAAETHVDRSIVGPAPFVRTNIEGTFSLLEAARRVWLEQRHLSPDAIRFHHVSTDEVYGNLTPDDPPSREADPYQPTSPYAASKAAADHIVRAYGKTYGLPVTLSNCSNNYGPRQFPEKLIPLMILHAVGGRRLPVYGDGQQVRDWIHVADHCDALWAILQNGVPGETYHVAAGNQPTNLVLIRQLCTILDARLPHSKHRPHEGLLEFVSDRPAHDRRYALDNRKIGRELGWRPSRDLSTGLQETVDWYLEHEDWVEAIRSRPSYRDWLETNYATRGGAR